MTDYDETIVEFAVRERLTKESIGELLDSMGGKRQGSRDEVAERLLAIKGLTAKDVLSKLSNEDLKVIVRRFGIPEATKQSGLFGIAGSILGDERSSLLKRIDDAASKQRPPSPKVAGRPPAPVERSPEPAPRPSPVLETPPPVTPPAPAHPPAPTTTMIFPGTMTAPASSPVALPVFQETRDFVGAYKFAYQWDSEDLYEAELLGALRSRFGVNNAVRQQGESGRVYDIVVRNSARIEVKLPKQKGELDRMIGQVRRYLAQHPGGVIVVIIGFMMKNQQEIHNSQEELESAGAVVFVK